MAAKALIVSGQPRVVIDGRLFALTYKTLSEAQSFADLLNKKPHPPADKIEPLIKTKHGTFTQRQWSSFIAGHSLH